MNDTRFKKNSIPWNKGKSQIIDSVCVVCDVTFKPKRPKNNGQKYCSRECYYKTRDKKVSKTCVECNKDFKVKRYEVVNKTRPAIYCSLKCSGQRMKEFSGAKSHLWRGGIKEYKCNECDKQFLSYKRVGNGTPLFCSHQCYSLSIVGKESSTKGMKFPERSGENHPRWIKDRSKLKKKQERGDSAYQEWRMQVYKRDNFKCSIENENCSGRIIAHHILGWSSFPELRYQVNNGITLCQAHHPLKRAEEKRLAPKFKELVSVLKV